MHVSKEASMYFMVRLFQVLLFPQTTYCFLMVFTAGLCLQITDLRIAFLEVRFLNLHQLVGVSKHWYLESRMRILGRCQPVMTRGRRKRLASIMPRGGFVA